MNGITSLRYVAPAKRAEVTARSEKDATTKHQSRTILTNESILDKQLSASVTTADTVTAQEKDSIRQDLPHININGHSSPQKASISVKRTENVATDVEDASTKYISQSKARILQSLNRPPSAKRAEVVMKDEDGLKVKDRSQSKRAVLKSMLKRKGSRNTETTTNVNAKDAEKPSTAVKSKLKKSSKKMKSWTRPLNKIFHHEINILT